ncbi:hypothetical protein [Treponema sp. R8-4-B8]
MAVGAWLHSKELGWIAGGFIFLCAVPWIIIEGIKLDISIFFERFVDKVDDIVARHDFNADMRAIERENERMMKWIDETDKLGDT